LNLTFGFSFNRRVELPENLVSLTLGEWFIQKVELPFSIKYLSLCSNNKVIDYLPYGIEELKLHESFNLELNNLLNSIKKIIIKNEHYNKKLNCLPDSVELLELPYYYKLKINKIPKGLKKIKCLYKYKFINNYANVEIEQY